MTHLNKLKRFFSIALFFVLIGFPTFSQADIAENTAAEEPDKYVRATLIADQTKVQGGEIIRIGLVFNIHPKWHVYWKNPGDSGTPPEINWTLPPGFSVSELEFPTPKKLPFGPLTNYGHEGNVTFLQNLTIPYNFTKNPFMLEATVNLLVCHDICIPETHKVSILFNEKTKGIPEAIKQAESALPVHKNWPSTYTEDNGNFIIKTIVEDVSELSKSHKFTFFPEDWGPVDNNAKVSLDILDTGFTLTQKRGERALTEISNLPFVLTYKDYFGKKKSIHLIAKPDNTEGAAVVPISKDIPTNIPTDTNANQNTGNSFGLWQALLFALFGGMILNLMPCVFPVLSMKALSLVSLKNKEEKKARGYGLSYTLGILLSFSIIGGTLLILKAGGAQIGWGFQLQSPIIIIFLTYLVFIIGLNFSGLFEFSGRFANFGHKLAQQSGNRGAFFTGILATLVATPCTAPFMGAAMGFALTQPAYISMLVFLALGFGLALPYLALCYIPALRTRLPKPGSWMETFRQFLAFPMFITTAWLIWVLSQQIASTDILLVLLSMISIVFLVWLARVLPAKGLLRILSQILIILSLIFVISLPFMPKKGTQNTDITETTNSQNWETYTSEKLTFLLEETDNPVFTNMTAAWCITCKVNEKIALSTSSAKQLFKEKNIQYLKGDWTNQNPEITRYLNTFNRQGVPLYVYYGVRNDQTGKRPEPVLLPQLLTAGLIEKTINKKP